MTKLRCMLCCLMICTITIDARTVNDIYKRISAQVSLKVPGNQSRNYSLAFQGAVDDKGIYLLESEEKIPLIITERIERDNVKCVMVVSITALEDVYFNYQQQLKTGFRHNDCMFYLPGFWYSRNLRSPKGAPSFHISESWLVREDRLSSPLTGIFNQKDGRYMTVARKDDFQWDALATHQTGEIILSGKTSLGFTGFESHDGTSTLSFGFPYREAPKTYIRKLSGGQKKRASIAVELLADPGLFFLDEPTSGLDPDTEQSLMNTLAELSKSEGKTIIMVTHTTQSIHLCDKVIFMGPGGKICYCGSPQGIYSYFQKKELVDVYNELGGNVDYWNTQYLQAYGIQSQSSHTVSEASMAKMRQSASRQVSSIRQLFVLTGRYFELIWNDKQRLLLLILQPLIISLLLTVVAKKDVFRIYNDTQSIMFALACAGIWIGLFNTIQEICKERPILKREYMGNLHLWTYILSKYIVQGVLCVLQSTILTVIFLAAMKHSPKAAVILPKPQLEIWVTVFLTIYASAAMGLIVSAFVKNSDRAMAVAPFVLIIQLLFSGVLFELEGLRRRFRR